MKRQKESIVNVCKRYNNFSLYMTVLLVGSLLPLIIIGRYNVMSADDYAMGKDATWIWQNTHSLVAMLRNAFQYTIKVYKTWQGCFTINFWDGLNPAFFGENMVWITPIIMLGAILFPLYMLCKTIISKYYKDVKEEIIVIWCALNFLTIQTMPSPSEGLYWYSGAIAYTLLQYFMLFLFVFILKIENQKKNIRHIPMVCLIAVWAFLVGGSQYITVLECLIWYALLLLINYKHMSWEKIVPGIALVSGFALSFLAPGNSVRMEAANGKGPAWAVLKSFVAAIQYGREWFSPMLVVVLLFMLPFVWKVVGKAKQQYRYNFPICVLILSFCAFAASFTPSLYGVGNVDAGRIQNLIQGIFYILIFFNVFYCVGWLRYQIEHSEKEVFLDLNTILPIVRKYGAVLKWCGFILIMLVLLGTRDRNTFASVSATRSLVLGEAKTYWEEAQVRLEIYRDENSAVAVIAPFSVKPHVLYFTDLVEEGDPNYWINENIAEYYRKEEVKLNE